MAARLKSVPTSVAARGRASHPASQQRALTDSYRFMRVLVVVMFIVTLDFTKFLDKGSSIRYLLLLVPFGGAFLIKMTSRTSLARKLSFADKILLVLLLFGGVGSVVGRVVFHTSSTALPIFFPMPMAFLYLLMVQDPTEEEVRKILLAIAAVGLLYVFLNAVANSGVQLPGSLPFSSVVSNLKQSRTYRNAEVMYIALGFAAVMFTGRRVRLMLFIGLAAFVFATYPSATSALVALVTAATLVVTRPRSTRARFYVAGLVIVSLVMVALLNFSGTVRLAGDYFNRVGKQDNTNTRIALWSAGLDKFGRSPVFGDAFTGETTVLVFRQSGGRAPFHNPYNDDYILFAASGGVFALLLLFGWIVWVEIQAFRRYRGFLASGQRYHAMLMRALVVGFNAWLTAAAFNPLFSGVGRSATLFSIFGLMMCLGRPAPLEALSLETGTRGT